MDDVFSLAQALTAVSINFNSIWYCDQKYVGCGLANGLSGARSTSRRMVLRISVRDLRAL